jgi:hypothetical protein
LHGSRGDLGVKVPLVGVAKIIGIDVGPVKAGRKTSIHGKLMRNVEAETAVIGSDGSRLLARENLRYQGVRSSIIVRAPMLNPAME